MENQMIVDSVEKLEELIKRVRKAQEVFAEYPQEKVDAIFKAAATAACSARQKRTARQCRPTAAVSVRRRSRPAAPTPRKAPVPRNAKG